MRVLVTGASGFSGSFIARRLAAGGHNIVGVHRRDSPFLEGLSGTQGLKFVRADLADAVHLPGSFDAVVHTAATSPAAGVTSAMIVHDNVDATQNLIEAAVRWRSRCFVFFSSLSLYGDISVATVDEATRTLKPNVYGASKLLCEQLLAERAEALPSLSLRLPGVVGPGAQRNWLSGVAERLVRGETVSAFHLDRPFNNAAHIEDVAKMIEQVFGQSFDGADAVVLGARGALSVRGAIERLAAGLGVTARIKECAAAKPSFVLSSERAIMRWGYDPLEIGTLLDRYAVDILAVH